MSSALCPGCQGEVHPLLGDAPLVLGDRVVVCCSAACRELLLSGQSGASSEQDLLRLADPDTGPAPDTSYGLARLQGAAASEPGDPPTAPSQLGGSQSLRAGAGHGAARPGRPPRRLLLAAMVGGGAMLLLLAGYLILAHASSSQRGSLAGLMRPGSPALSAVSPPRRAPPAAAPGRKRVVPRPEPKRPSLMTLKRRSWTILEGFLASRTGRYWRTAARVLAEQGHSGALAALRRGLRSGSWAKRQRAAEALARLGHPEGLEALRRDLSARRRPVKWASAFALARCGDSSGLRVIKQLANFRQHRMTAYEALVRLGDRRGKRYLRKVLASSAPPYDRLRAAVALGLAGDRSGLLLLQARMKRPGMHMGVALALQKLGAPEARPALVRAMEHTALREEAARALKAYGDVTLVSKMAPDLGSSSEDSRLTAAAAIVILTAQARAEAR